MSADRWSFVLSAYGISAFVLLALIVWIVASRRAVQRDLAALETAGIKRRSDS
ncbi:MAG: heme exporter protein CcmD [Rhizobiaceae bacterium]